MNPNLQDNQLSDTDQRTSGSARPRRVEKNGALRKLKERQLTSNNGSSNGNERKGVASKHPPRKRQSLEQSIPAIEEKLPASLRRRVRPKKESGPPSVQLLCLRMAFIYQRLSTTEQKKNSRYSLERQDDLERIAQEDGYPTALSPAQIEELRKDPDYPGHYVNGHIVVEQRDLGVSGTKGQEEREGLAYLVQLIEEDKVESVYVIEISRISRDQTLITGLQFGELCREHGVIIVTPTMRLNLRDEMHMRMYRYEIDRAAEELKSIRFRMQGAKDMKARHGYAVGGSLPTGYVIDTEERLKDGTVNPNHQKYKIYEPHAKVIRTLFRMMAKPGAHYKSVALECKRKGIVFPRLPEEILAIKGNATAFMLTKKDQDGNYPITRKRVESIVTNPAYIGWFLWSGEVISKDNHAAIIDEETFWAVQKKSKAGYHRTEIFQPLPLAGLLHCSMHESPRRMKGSNGKNRQRASYECVDVDYEDICATLTAYILEEPLEELVISQCSLPGFADKVLKQISDRHDEAKARAAANKRKYQMLTKEIENYQINLGHTTDRKRVEMYQNLIDEREAERDKLTKFENQPMHQVMSAAEVEMIRKFLAHIDTGWGKMTDELKNAFLSVILQRIDITHDAATIVAKVLWRTEIEQVIEIQRSFVDNRREWTKEENAIIRTNYERMQRPELLALLSGRTWGAIRRQAVNMGMNRPIEMRTRLSAERPYTAEEDQVIRDFHNYTITRDEMRRRLPERSDDSIQLRAHSLGFRKRKPHVTWRLVSTRQITEGEERGQGKGQRNGPKGAQNKSLEVVPNGNRSRTRSSRSPGSRARSLFPRTLCSSAR